MPKILVKPNENGDLVIPKEALVGLNAPEGFEVNVEAAMSLEERLKQAAAASVDFWSPKDSYEAAAILSKVIAEGKQRVG